MFIVIPGGGPRLRKTSACGYGSRLARSLSSGAHSRDPLAWPGRRESLRRELYFRRGGADVGVDLGFEFCKILLEHADQRTRGLVELDLVGPGLDRIGDLRVDAGQLGRHCKTE